MKPKVVVFIEGGVVHEIVSNADVDVKILDSDMEGVAEEHPQTVEVEGSSLYQHKIMHSVDLDRVDRIFGQLHQESNFRLHSTTISFCSICKKPVKLLSRQDGAVLCFVCFPCGKMWEPGVGPVKEED